MIGTDQKKPPRRALVLIGAAFAFATTGCISERPPTTDESLGVAVQELDGIADSDGYDDDDGLADEDDGTNGGAAPAGNPEGEQETDSGVENPGEDCGGPEPVPWLILPGDDSENSVNPLHIQQTKSGSSGGSKNNK
ncbi:MAG: hypothetical protein IPK82_17985 [Polyangiaceae bacterium]|nr:hypothetical protein [Polyangiaceae bacterium]